MGPHVFYDLTLQFAAKPGSDTNQAASEQCHRSRLRNARGVGIDEVGGVAGDVGGQELNG